MNIYKSKTYISDLKKGIDNIVGNEKLRDCSILVAGATGLVGSCIVDLLLTENKFRNMNIKIYALSRSIDRLSKRFKDVDDIIFIEADVNENPEYDFNIDYIIYAASNAYPAAFNRDPVGTIASNIIGLKNMLDYGKDHLCKRFMYISSGEVYGQGDLTLNSFSENYSGYVNPVSVRSCYPNSKRTAETLCVAYTKQYGLETVIVRPCHSYGPNATVEDNRANVQFVNQALKGQDIVLKSAGTQLRSYCYIIDTACAILSVLTTGESTEPYNIANTKSIVTIAEFAVEVANKVGVKVVFESPDEEAKAEQTPIEKQVLNCEKIKELGWQGTYDIKKGIKHTIEILKEIIC